MKDLSQIFYAKQTTPLEFKFDSLTTRPLFSMIPPELDAYIYGIATNLRLNAKLKEKYRLMDDALAQYGFELLARGTNRSTYKYFYDSSVVLKVGYDKAGISDAAREFYNQQVLKPFVTKCFEVSPSGAIGLFERVNPITYKDEFKSIAEDVFELLTKFILGKYILADIGTDYYMNWGLRTGFGPVLLDYPFMYELDGKKLHCINTVKMPDGTMVPCDGLIDYDDGFNHLVCERCGKKYFAQDLAKYNSLGQLEIVRGALGGSNMARPVIWKDGEIFATYGTSNPLEDNRQVEKQTPLRAFMNWANEQAAKQQRQEQQAQEAAIHQAMQQVHAQRTQPQQQTQQVQIPEVDLESVVKSVLMGILTQQGLTQPQPQQQTKPAPQIPLQSQQPAQANFQPAPTWNPYAEDPQFFHPMTAPKSPAEIENVAPVAKTSSARGFVSTEEVDKERYSVIQEQLQNRKRQSEAQRYQNSRGNSRDRIKHLMYKLKRAFGDLYCRARVNDRDLLQHFVMGAIIMIDASEGIESENVRDRAKNIMDSYIKEILDNIEKKRQRQQQQQPGQHQRHQNQKGQPKPQQQTQPNPQPAPRPQQQAQPAPQPQPTQVVFDTDNRIGNPYTSDPNLNVEDDISEEVESQFEADQDVSESELESMIDDINPEDGGEEYSGISDEAMTQIEEDAKSKF